MAAATQKIIIHADDKTGAAVASAVRNTKKLDQQIKRTGDAMRTSTRQSRAHMAQLGHQVQDIAVQYQMGVNPLMILGQQGSQVASIFGTKGALFGGLLAIAAVLGQQLIPNLFKTADGFDKLQERAEALGLTIKDIAPFLFREEKINIEEQLRSAEKAFRDATKRVQELNEEYESGDEAPSLGSARTQYFDTLAKQIQEARKEAERARLALLEARRAAGEFTEVPMGQRISPRPVAEFTPQKDPLEALRRRADALKRSLDPMKAYQHSLQELQRMEANNLITKRELAQATEELRSRYIDVEEPVKLLKDANKELLISMEDVERNGIMALEDSLISLIDGTKSVKDAFKDMARSIIADLIQMQVRAAVTVPLANAMGIPLAGKRASGGPVSANKPYLVGEKGPEIMVPQGAGRVIPNQDMSGGGVTVVQNLSISTGVSQTVRAEITNLLPQITNAAKSAVADARQRGGGYSKALVGA